MSTTRRILISGLIYVGVLFGLFVAGMIVGGDFLNFITAFHLGALVNFTWIIATVVIVDKHDTQEDLHDR